jgi:hypothetical protein
MADQRPEKASELLTECSSQAMEGESQRFGNMTAANLRNNGRHDVAYSFMRIGEVYEY